MGSLQCVVENPLKYPKLTIVYHLSTSGTLVNARKPLCNMTASTWQPTYIYIKEIRIHNSMRYKVDRVCVDKNLCEVKKILWLVCMWVVFLTNPVSIWLKGRTTYVSTCTILVDYCQLFRRTSCNKTNGHHLLRRNPPQNFAQHATKQNHSKNSNAGYHLHKPELSYANPTQPHATGLHQSGAKIAS
jgi:hypothetical protein